VSWITQRKRAKGEPAEPVKRRIFGPVLIMMGEFEASVKKHPLIAMGTLDPYTPAASKPKLLDFDRGYAAGAKFKDSPPEIRSSNSNGLAGAEIGCGSPRMSQFGTKRTSSDVRVVSAPRGITEVGFRGRQGSF
jgi:hypothetical protein